jgi:hypothetical protein
MGILTIDAIKQQSVSCCHEDECKTGGGNSCLPLVVHAGRQFGTPLARGKDCHSNVKLLRNFRVSLITKNNITDALTYLTINIRLSKCIRYEHGTSSIAK